MGEIKILLVNLLLLLRSQLEWSAVDKTLNSRELVQKQYVFILLIKVDVVQIGVKDLGIHDIAATLSWLQIKNRTEQFEEILDDVITCLSIAEQKIVSLLFEHYAKSRLLISYPLVVDHVETLQDVHKEHVILILGQLLEKLLVLLLECSYQVSFRLLIGFGNLGLLICLLVLSLLQSLILLIRFIM